MKATIFHTNSGVALALLALIQMLYAACAMLVMRWWSYEGVAHLIETADLHSAVVGVIVAAVSAAFTTPVGGIVWVAKYYAQRPAEVYRNGIEVSDG